MYEDFAGRRGKVAEGVNMDFIIEILLEIILDDALESVTEKKIPLPIRIFVALVLLVFYLGFGGCLLYIGIAKKNGMMTGIAIFWFLMIACVIIRKCKELRR